MDCYDPSGYYKNPVEKSIGGILKKDFDDYLGDVEKCTGRKISAEQREKMYEFLREHDVSKPVSEKEYNDICKEFKKGKIRCGIKENGQNIMVSHGQPTNKSILRSMV